MVRKLTPRVLMVLLDQEGLSSDGTLEELQERRLRFDVMKLVPGFSVPVYDDDFRRDSLPTTTAELITQASREEIDPSPSAERAPAEVRDNTLAPPRMGGEGRFVSTTAECTGAGGSGCTGGGDRDTPTVYATAVAHVERADSAATFILSPRAEGRIVPQWELRDRRRAGARRA